LEKGFTEIDDANSLKASLPSSSGFEMSAMSKKFKKRAKEHFWVNHI
jgi:hypothetical protein